MPVLPISEVIPLAQRTIALGRKSGRARRLWGRIAEFAAVDLKAALAMVNDLVEARLGGTHAYLRLTELGPVLRPALASTERQTREDAVRLVHRLGEHGFLEFGELLDIDEV
jgi:hypothetical protein